MSEQSAIQELYFGTDVLPVAVDGGAFTITLGAHTTASINFNDDIDTAITPALEVLPEIGTGNIGIEDVLDGDSNRIGLIFTFKNGKANTPVATMTVDSSLTLSAGTLDLEPVQTGADPTPVTPTLTSPYVSAIAPVPGANEVQLLSLNGATMGQFQMVPGNGNSFVDVGNLILGGATYLQPILDATFGNGLTSVVDNGDGTYSVTFFGGFWHQIPVYSTYGFIAIASQTGLDAVPSVAITTPGVTPIPGVPQEDTITYSQTPTIGATKVHTIGGDNEFEFDADAATFQAWLRGHIDSGILVTGSPAAGFLITYSDFITHDSSNGIISVTSSTLAPLGIGGSYQIFSVTLSTDPVPDSGEWTVSINLFGSSNIETTDDGAAVTAKLPNGWTATGSAGGPYTFTAPLPAADVTVAVNDVSLKKAVGAMIDVIQVGISGGGGGTSRARSLQLLRS